MPVASIWISTTEVLLNHEYTDKALSSGLNFPWVLIFTKKKNQLMKKGENSGSSQVVEDVKPTPNLDLESQHDKDRRQKSD